MGKIITFATLKGGTGKTTAVFSLGGILGEKGFNVLLIDMDPQANLTSNMGMDETAKGYTGIKNLIEDNRIFPEEVIVKAPIVELPSVDVIGATVALTATEMVMIKKPNREFILSRYLERNKLFFERYDYILIDTNPSMSIINQNAFVVSDGIIVVGDFGVNALKGIELFLAIWGEIVDKLELPLNIKGVLLNKYEENELSHEYIQYCREDEEISRLLFTTCISKSSSIPEAELERRPINIEYKDSKLHLEFQNFADELLERLDS